MSTLKVASINHPSASSGGLAISASGNVTGAGLDLITTQSFSAVSSVSVNNCFSGDYDNYRLLVNWTASADINLQIRLRAAGTDRTGASYVAQRFLASDTTLSGARLTGQTTGLFGAGSTDPNSTSADIFSPYLNDATRWISFSSYSVGTIVKFDIAGRYTTADVNDGFTLYPPSGTFTGTVSVFGYRK